MKTYDEINVNENLSYEDFCVLFARIPLNEEEKNSLNDYYKMYKLFLSSEVKPVDAWVVVRNIFAIKNQQIVERINK